MAAMRLIIFCLCLLPGLPAEADETRPLPYGRYEVSNVAAGDRLNVREQAGTGSAVAGSLAPGTGGIMVSGSQVEIDGQVWWQVIPSPASPVTGWVNSRFLTRISAERDTDHDYPLACAGTEPFWSLTIAGGKAGFENLSVEEKQDWTAGKWVAPAGNPWSAFVVGLSAGDARGYAVIKEEEDFCTDNMSEIEFPFYVTLIDPAGGVFTGCCSRRAP